MQPNLRAILNDRRIAWRQRGPGDVRASESGSVEMPFSRRHTEGAVLPSATRLSASGPIVLSVGFGLVGGLR